MKYTIELRGVTAGHHSRPAIHDLNLVVSPGEVVALLGANGAGKTTTVRTVCGVTGVLHGAVRLLGRDVTNVRARIRAGAGLATVPDDRGVFTQLTVAENLRVGGSRRQREVPIDSWFPDLVPLLGRRAGVLSGGEQTILALARAIAGRPRALVVDELTTGLAGQTADSAMAVLRRTATEWGTGVLLAEQGAGLALEVADRAYVLRGGRIALEGIPTEIAEQTNVLESTYLGEIG